jgi:hypothetical protein
VRILATLAISAAVLTGCGGSGGGATSATTTSAPPARTVTKGRATGKLPPGAVGPVETADEATEGPAATEASPEASPEGPAASGDLSDSDRSAVSSVVSSYVDALNRRRAARVCALLAPGALDLHELPRRRRGCRSSLRASIGIPPRSGGPAWRRTAIVEVKTERLGDDRARVSATVTHRFSDRKYVSVEDDVIYVERLGGAWRLAKPSATLYRAVGYRSPPLRAFSPPAGW